MGLMVEWLAMAFVSESEATRLLRRSSCTRKKGAFRKTSNALRLIKILLHRLLDYRSCETDRCICIGCIGLDPPLSVQQIQKCKIWMF